MGIAGVPAGALALCPAELLFVEKENDRAGDEDGGVGPHDDADEQGESKIVDDRPAKGHDRAHNQERSEGCQNCPRQGFVDSLVDDLPARLASIKL